MKTWRFTNKEGKSRAGLTGETQWGENATHSVDWSGRLCSPGCLHSYADPVLAVMLDPAHGKYLAREGAILWEGEASGSMLNDGTKIGSSTYTTLHPVPIPFVPLLAKARFGILASLTIKQSVYYIAWAENWLCGKNRATAGLIVETPVTSAWAAASSAWAAWVAAHETSHAWIQIRTAWAETRAAEAAVWAAEIWTALQSGEAKIDLVALAHKAIADEAQLTMEEEA